MYAHFPPIPHESASYSISYELTFSLVGEAGCSASVASHQRLQQRFGVLKVCGVKPLGKPAVDWCQKVMGFLAFALLLPESSEAGGSTEFPRFGLLILSYRNSLGKTSFCRRLVVRILLEQRGDP